MKLCSSDNHYTTTKHRIKTKKIHLGLEFNQSQWLKPYVEFNTKKKNRSRKNGDKDRELFRKLIKNAV